MLNEKVVVIPSPAKSCDAAVVDIVMATLRQGGFSLNDNTL